MKKEIIKVEGMHCPSCVALLENDVEELNGVSNVSASLENGTLEVEFDENAVNVQQIKEVVTNCGFKAL